MMSETMGDVKQKESDDVAKSGELEAFGLRQNIVGDAIPQQKPRAGILRGQGGKPFARGSQISETFQAKVASVGVFHDDVVAKFERTRVSGTHENYSPVR